MCFLKGGYVFKPFATVFLKEYDRLDRVLYTSPVHKEGSFFKKIAEKCEFPINNLDMKKTLSNVKENFVVLIA